MKTIQIVYFAMHNKQKNGAMNQELTNQPNYFHLMIYNYNLYTAGNFSHVKEATHIYTYIRKHWS